MFRQQKLRLEVGINLKPKNAIGVFKSPLDDVYQLNIAAKEISLMVEF
jgi:hypothetical protein